jgi:hypothetical protein
MLRCNKNKIIFIYEKIFLYNKPGIYRIEWV